MTSATQEDGKIGELLLDTVPKTRLPPKIALDFVLENCRAARCDGGTYNPYIMAFSDMPWIPEVYEAVRDSYAVKQIMNHRNLKKEITESFSAIAMADKALRRASLPDTPFAEEVNSDVDIDLSFSALRRRQSDLLFLDVCSGKGILSFLLTFLFPTAKVVMIDFNAKIKRDHLSHPRFHQVSFVHVDLYTPAASEYIERLLDEESMQGRTVISFGLHLCGTLSTRLVELFNNQPRMDVLVLSPCCMPIKRKGGDKLNELIRRTQWCGYSYWCLFVFNAVHAGRSVRNICVDPHVESDKHSFIIAIKRNILRS
jgi:hypothetical protein